MKAYLTKLKIVLLQNKIIILFFLITIIHVSIYISVFNPKPLNNNCIYGYIYDYKIDNDKIILKIKSNKRIQVNYYGEYNPKYGEYVKVVGNFKELNENTNFNMFNYKHYLYSNRIYYEFNASSITRIKKSNNAIYIIKNKIVNRIEKCKYSKKYLYVFLLSNKNYLEDELYSSYKNLGLIHLICISGMYISCIIFLFKKLKVKNVFIIIYLILYSFILNLSVSIIRCLFMFIFRCLKDKYKLNISNIKALLVIAFIVLIINPFYIYNIGFIFSFVISFGLYYSKSKYSSLVAFFYSIPILINNYFKINFISLFMNIIFIPFISYIIFPFSVLVFIFNSLDKYFFYLTSFMDKMLLKMSDISIFSFSFSKQNIILIIIYYLILILCVKNKKFIIGIITMVFIFYFNGYYLVNPRVYYLDVGQGDSSLIRIKNKNYMIDTGGKWNSNYSLTDNLLIPFSNSVGVKKIDYLILTHGDHDHMGEAINLVNNYKVDNVIFNCGPYNDLENELIKVLENKNIKYYSCVNKIDNLYFLQTNIYDNENDNSNVIYTKMNGYKFLFMGDAGINKEKDILKEYNISNIDVLKVGHHGSKTSSSKEFISEINPKYSIISVGKNNRYGHPNKEVLNYLNNSIIYRTDQNGSIMFKLKNYNIIVNK